MRSHEPRNAEFCEEGANRVTFKDAQWGLEKPFFFSRVLNPHPPLAHRPVIGWLGSIIPTNETWFSLWSGYEVDWLADRLTAHLEKPIQKSYVIVRDYFLGY